MNWDNQLSSILSAADGSVAKMRERLASPGKFSKGSQDLFPVGDVIRDSDLPPPATPTRVPQSQWPSSSLPLGVHPVDLSTVQSQLQIQTQAIESLTKKVQSMERERESQQHQIHKLQEEIQSLREESKDRERDKMRRGQSPETERMMEQWRREVGRELSTLRGHITRATSLGNLEESFSSKLRREELEHLRGEVDQLKTRLRRQEEDMFVQRAEVRETRRRCEHGCKSLEQFTDSYRTHSFDLAKAVSQYMCTQQEVRQIGVTVSELKDEVRNLILSEHQPTSVLPPRTTDIAPAPQFPSSRSGEVRGQQPDSDSEDFSPTPSLAEVSSEELSWLEDIEPATVIHVSTAVDPLLAGLVSAFIITLLLILKLRRV